MHMGQLMPLPLTVPCFSKIQIGFTFLVPAHLGSPGKRAVKRMCVCVCVCYCCRQAVSDEGLRGSAASACVPRPRRLPGHSLLARSARPAAWNGRDDDHLLPGQGRPRPPAAAAQVGAGGRHRDAGQDQAQGEPNAGQLMVQGSCKSVSK